MIKQYIRNKKNQKIGVIVAGKSNSGEVKLGWSLCHKNDRFNSDRGFCIAAARMMMENRAIPISALNSVDLSSITNHAYLWVVPYKGIHFPRSILADVKKMGIRAKKYFKTS